MNYVDVNVFIYWLGSDPNFGETATKIMERIERGEKAITSALTPWLIHIVLEREAREYEPEAMIEKLRLMRNLRIVPVKMEDYESAIRLGKRYDLDLEDALHLSVAIANNAKRIYSTDRDFDRGPLKRAFE